MSIVIFYLEMVADLGGPVLVPRHETFGESELVPALNRTQALRLIGMKHVVMSMESSCSIGKPGVDTVEDGKTPDGHPYTWMKRRTQ
jgi:hypothetical protein